MKQYLIIITTLFVTSLLSGQNLTFENIEKNTGQYYTNIEATLLTSNFEFLNYDNKSKKLTYQYISEDDSENGNKFCYIWRNEDDKAKTITYFTTDHQEYVNWKKAILYKNYRSKPIIDEGDSIKEWFFSKQYGVKILKKQLDNADKSKKIIAYILTIIKTVK